MIRQGIVTKEGVFGAEHVGAQGAVAFVGGREVVRALHVRAVHQIPVVVGESDLGDEGRTLVFDAARSNAFFRDAKSPSPGVELVDSTTFLALDGRRSVSGLGHAFHLDAAGLVEFEGEIVLNSPELRGFEVAIRPEVRGDQLTLDMKSVWSDAAWVGQTPRPSFVDLSAISTVPLSGSTVLVVSRVLEIGPARRERYVLAVSPRVLRAAQVATVDRP